MSSLVTTINLLILIGILMFVVLGSLNVSYEMFSEPAASASASFLTEKELELFQDLKHNRLSDEDIKQLIKDGVLTDILIEKFLKRIDFPPMTKLSEEPKKSEEVTEAFSCETAYVGAPKGWDTTDRWWDGSPVAVDDEHPDATAAATKYRGTCVKA
jgi:hypothetical protein